MHLVRPVFKICSLSVKESCQKYFPYTNWERIGILTGTENHLGTGMLLYDKE